MRSSDLLDAPASVARTSKVTSYVIPFVTIPTVMLGTFMVVNTDTPVSTHREQRSTAVSRLGANLDDQVARIARDLAILRGPGQLFPDDIIVAMPPKSVKRHRARLLSSTRSLELVETAADFDAVPPVGA